MDKLAFVPVVENKLQFAMQSKLKGLVLHPQPEPDLALPARIAR